MQTILFLDQKKAVKAEVKRLSKNTIQITGVTDINTSGFYLFTLPEKPSFKFTREKFEDFTTLYRELEDGFILSNDGSVYVEPYVATIAEVRQAKIIEMNGKQQDAIKDGVDITLADGTVEHFKLTEHDQLSLMGLQTEVARGTELIPWHTSDETQHCKFYTNADMKTITETALRYVTYHVTYFRDLRIYIRSLENKEDVESVEYGMIIPEEYQSEPLKNMIASAAQI